MSDLAQAIERKARDLGVDMCQVDPIDPLAKAKEGALRDAGWEMFSSWFDRGPSRWRRPRLEPDLVDGSCRRPGRDG